MSIFLSDKKINFFDSISYLASFHQTRQQGQRRYTVVSAAISTIVKLNRHGNEDANERRQQVS